MVTITNRGELSNSVERIKTGLYSLDWALIDSSGNIGLPTRSIIEIAGSEGCGKSTVMFSLAGIAARALNRDILLLDFERQNYNTIQTCLSSNGFLGNLDWETFEDDFISNEDRDKKKKSKNKKRTSEQLLDMMVERCYDANPKILMLDSLAAFDVTGSYEGSIADADMGLRAKVLRKWFRHLIRPLNSNPNPTIVFFTNHLTQVIGGFRPSPNSPVPTTTTGGTAPGYFSTQVISIKPLFGWAFPSKHGWVVEGKILKNRDGYSRESRQVLYLYLQAGEGINRNMTAVVDCVMLNIASTSSKSQQETATITLDGVEYKIQKLIDERYNNDLFVPFHNALASQSGGIEEYDVIIGGNNA